MNKMFAFQLYYYYKIRLHEVITMREKRKRGDKIALMVKTQSKEYTTLQYFLFDNDDREKQHMLTFFDNTSYFETEEVGR